MKNKVRQFNLDSFLNSSEEAFHIARTTISTREDLQLHSHDYAEIFWIKEGQGIHIINGKEHRIGVGTLCMIRPEDEHTFKVSSSESIVVTNLAFKRDSLDYYQKRYFPDSSSLFWAKSDMPFTCELSHSNLNELSGLTDRLLTQPKTALNLDHIVLHIFSLASRIEEVHHGMPHWLKYSIDNFNTPLQFKKGIDGFTKLAGKSTDHINRTTQKYLKQTLSTTLNKLKLQYAAQQLVMTNTPIKKICTECGFSNLSYFYRTFQKLYNLSPSKYRSKNHKIF